MSNVPEQPPEDSPSEELSLRSLSEAFAEALARGRADTESPQADPGVPDQTASEHVEDARPTDEAPTVPPVSVPEPPFAPEPTESENDPCPVNPRTIFEAMLFVGDAGNRPLESAQAASLMRGVEAMDVLALVDQLNASYRERGCPYRVTSDEAGFRLTLDTPYYSVRDKFYGRIREARLSQAAIDVLAIVAYRQPIRSDEVSRLRDKPSHHILSQLVRRRLLRVERPAESPRKPLYHTTERFLELFELASLAELPESEALTRD